MQDKELLKILNDEEKDSTSFYSSELAKEQAEAMERYYAQPYGDEIEGRSSVLTHDVADTMDWIMPDIRRVFSASDDLVSLKPTRQSDEKHVENAAQYLQHVFFEDNDGNTIIHDFAFDGLLQKLGVIAVRWEDGEKQPPQELEGVTPEQLQEYLNDDEYEILEQEETSQNVQGQDIPTFNLKVVKTPMGRCLVENVPPEEFRVSRHAKSLAKADYVARSRIEFASELAKQWPDKKRELMTPDGGASQDEDIDTDSDPRKNARFEGEGGSTFDSDDTGIGRKRVTLLEEYVRVDDDDDGIVELLHVKRVGSVILEKMPVDETEFAIWSPIPVAHKLIGRSIADRVVDIQKIRTVTTRNAMDNLSLSIRPRSVVDTTAMSEDTIDILLDHEIGGVIPVRGPADRAISPLVIPDMTSSAFQMLEYWDQQSEVRTGVTRHSQGLDPEALTKTASGMSMLQNASAARKEFIAACMGKGLESVFKLILKCVSSFQDHARVVKVNEEWVNFDPRLWSDEMVIRVHVGQGTGSRETQIGNLSIIAQKQEQLLAAQPDNPIVTLKNLHNTYARMAEAMGFRDTTQFFTTLPEDYQPPEPGPNPELAKVQAETQAKSDQMKIDAQMKQQEAAMTADLRNKEFEAEQGRKERQAAADIKLKEDQIAAELNLKEKQLAAELDLKERQIIAEMELKAAQGIVGASTSVNISDVQPGGDPG